MSLIERLRETSSKGVSVWGDLQMEAATEIERLTAENAAFEPFLKEGETPFERFTRERMDGDALLKIYGKALTEIEALKADVAAMRANQKAYVAIHAACFKATAERDALKAELENFVDAKRYDKDHFEDDSYFADWVQSRAAFAIKRPLGQGEAK
jgi:hypothetical protein